MSAAAFDPFAPGAGSVTVLLAARATGLLLVAPVFSARTVPAMTKAGLLALVVALIHPVAMAGVGGAAPAVTFASAMGELLIGFAMGLGAALLVGAAEVAGEMMTTQIGLSGAALFDPVSNQQSAVLATFANLFAVTVLLTFDAHLVLLDALATSTRLLPVGAPVAIAPALQEMVMQGMTLFALGARFAAPVIAMVLIANIALAALSRAAPSLNILTVAFPIQIVTGLLALAAALPLIGAWFAGWTGPYDTLVTRVFDAFATGGR